MMSARADQEAARAWRVGGVADLPPDPSRLDDRTWHIVGEAICGVITGIEEDIRSRSDGRLAHRGSALPVEMPLRDPAIVEDLAARVRLDLIGEALPIAIVDPEEPSLLVRLVEAPDRSVAEAARTLLAADSRRRDALESGTTAQGDMPADLYRRLVWWVAAVIGADTDIDTDHVLTEAALHVAAAHDESERAEVAAMRLAAALNLSRADLQDLLVAALGDGRVRLFTALLAHALGAEFEQVRDLVLDAQGDRLWTAMRALNMDRATIARVAACLAEAGVMHDLDALAERLDGIIDLPAAQARDALRPLWWRREYREAIRAVRGVAG